MLFSIILYAKCRNTFHSNTLCVNGITVYSNLFQYQCKGINFISRKARHKPRPYQHIHDKYEIIINELLGILLISNNSVGDILVL